jgi:hypothetical protein
MLVVGVDLSDMKTGNLDMIRQYMKPIPRYRAVSWDETKGV